MNILRTRPIGERVTRVALGFLEKVSSTGIAKRKMIGIVDGIAIEQEIVVVLVQLVALARSSGRFRRRAEYSI